MKDEGFELTQEIREVRITKNKLRSLIKEEMRRKRLNEIAFSPPITKKRKAKIKSILKQKWEEAGGEPPGATEYVKIHLKKIKNLNPLEREYFEEYVQMMGGVAPDGDEFEDLPDSEEEVAALNLPKYTMKVDSRGVPRRVKHGSSGEEEIFSVSARRDDDKDPKSKRWSGSADIDYTRIMGDILSGHKGKVLKQGMGGNAYKNSKDPKKQIIWAQIKLIQQLLIDSGYAEGLFTKADGDYGGLTKKAVIKFQTDLKLSIDGVVGRQTATAFDPRKKAQKVPITGKEIEDSVQEMVLDLPPGTMKAFREETEKIDRAEATAASATKGVNEGFRRWGVLAGVGKSSGHN